MKAVLKISSFSNLVREIYREEFGEESIQQIADTFDGEEVFLKTSSELGTYIKEILEFDRDFEEGSGIHEFLSEVYDCLHENLPRISRDLSKITGCYQVFEGDILDIQFIGSDDLVLVEFR